IEEHGSGRQMLRIRAWPRVWLAGLAAAALLAVVAAGAWLSGAPVVTAVVGAGVVALAGLAMLDGSAAMGVLVRALDAEAHEDEAQGPVDERSRPADGPLDVIAKSPALAARRPARLRAMAEDGN